MKRTTTVVALLGSLVLMTACSKSSEPETAPAEYKVKFDTSKGTFVVDVHRDWAPFGADRFYELAKTGFYNDARFFRVVPGFMVQWGIPKDPAVAEKWRVMNIPDDPVKQSNKRGYITFATAGPNTRTTQLFINYADNAGLDGQGFAPFGQVTDGIDVVQNIYSVYGETPNQGQIQTQGNAYLQSSFPNLDFIKSTTIEK